MPAALRPDSGIGIHGLSSGTVIVVAAHQAGNRAARWRSAWEDVVLDGVTMGAVVWAAADAAEVTMASRQSMLLNMNHSPVIITTPAVYRGNRVRNKTPGASNRGLCQLTGIR